MTLVDVPESTKQLWTLKLNILNDNQNSGQSEFAFSIKSMLSIDESESGDLLGPLLEEATLPMEVFPSVQKNIPLTRDLS